MYSVKKILTLSLLYIYSLSAQSNPNYQFDLDARIEAERKAANSPSLFDNVESEYKKEPNKKYIKSDGNKNISISWAPEIVESALSIFDSGDSDDNGLDRPEYTEEEKEFQISKIDDDTYLNFENYNSSSGLSGSVGMLFDLFDAEVIPEQISEYKIKTNFSNSDKRFYGYELCDYSEYSCIKVGRNDTWKTIFPNAKERELVQRINRTNRGLWRRNWILVPNDLSLHPMDYSPLDYERSDYIGKKLIVISLEKLAFGAYDKNGDLVRWGPINPGTARNRTPKGDFKVYRKGSKSCWSKKFDTGIPYCVFFNGGYAIHGYSMPGYPASHGCVRAYNSDAKWINKEFADYKTRVIVE